MKRFDEFMFIQWLIFTIDSTLKYCNRIYQGIMIALSNLILQIKQDTSISIIKKTNSWKR
jgi:hypothetical protein